MPLVPDVEAATAIMLVNPGQMETRAWRLVFDAAKFPLDSQIALSIVAAQSYTHAGTSRTMQFYKALALWLGKSVGAAERLARRLEGQFLSQTQNQDRGTVHHWHLKNSEVRDALARFAELKRTIHRVVELQLMNPDDPESGKDLLPETVYFNIVANRHDALRRDKEQNATLLVTAE